MCLTCVFQVYGWLARGKGSTHQRVRANREYLMSILVFFAFSFFLFGRNSEAPIAWLP